MAPTSLMLVLMLATLGAFFAPTSLCCSLTAPALQAQGLSPYDSTSWYPSYAGYNVSGFTRTLPSVVDDSGSTKIERPDQRFIDLSYGDMIFWFGYKIRVDLLALAGEVQSISIPKWQSFCQGLKEGSSRFLNGTLWMIFNCYLWCVLYTIRLIASFLLMTWKPMSAIGLTLAITSSIVWAIKRIYSCIPVFWIGIPFKVLYKTLRWLFRKNGDEKAVQGFNSYSVKMAPPGKSVLEILFADNSHCGYASCVRLQTGEDALLTSLHCCDPTHKVRSFRTGSMIPLSQFQIVFPSEKLDLAILRGPTEWKSLLGAKASYMKTADRLTKQGVSFFTFDGQWEMHNAKVVGSDGLYTSVLSNTTKGYSGTPYFVGKDIIGVHKGYDGNDPSKNYNLMAPIPPIEGLTKPQYVFESSTIDGDVYSEEEIEELTKYAVETFEKVKKVPSSWRPNHKEDWWLDSLADESASHIEAPVNVELQGNGARGTDHQEKPESTLAKPADSTDDMLREIVAQIVGRIDLSALTQRVEGKLLNQVKSAQNKRTQQPEAKRTRSRKRNTSKNSSSPPSNGMTNQHLVKSQGSGKPDASPRYIIPKNRKTQPSGTVSSAPTQKWRPKSPVSGGPSSALPPKRQV
nr:MAG: peptidase S39 [Guiyang Paspalum paspaloides solemo-like virus 1]